MKWNLRNEFTHVVQDDILAIGMQIGIEGSIHEANMDLILYDIELLLISFGSDFTEVLRNLCLAKCHYTFVLEVSTKGHFDESLIRCDVEYEIVVIELSFEQFVCVLIIE